MNWYVVRASIGSKLALTSEICTAVVPRYNKDLQDEQAREEELRKIKEAESDALAVAL